MSSKHFMLQVANVRAYIVQLSLHIFFSKQYVSPTYQESTYNISCVYTYYVCTSPLSHHHIQSNSIYAEQYHHRHRVFQTSYCRWSRYFMQAYMHIRYTTVASPSPVSAPPINLNYKFEWVNLSPSVRPTSVHQSVTLLRAKSTYVQGKARKS